MIYKLSFKAKKDLVTIYLYGKQAFGIEQAEKYNTGLIKSFDFIAENPHAVRERTEFTPPVRIHNFGSHIIIYNIENDYVLILRILSGRQYWQHLI
jgi:toxin ParE1/3/4